MAVPVGFYIWSGCLGATMPDVDAVAAPSQSLWFPDHVQYDSERVAEERSLLTFFRPATRATLRPPGAVQKFSQPSPLGSGDVHVGNAGARCRGCGRGCGY